MFNKLNKEFKSTIKDATISKNSFKTKEIWSNEPKKENES